MVCSVSRDVRRGAAAGLRAALLLATAAICAGWPAPGQAQLCGKLDNDVGPYDYTAPSSLAPLPARGRGAGESLLSRLEKRYFTNDIENLAVRDSSGKPDTGRLLSSLDYTLRAFPNHHRALYSVLRLDLQIGRFPQAPAWRWPRSADCYFDRALRFRPQDPVVHLLQGIYLHRSGKLNEALAAYRQAEKLNPKLADLQYNMGLLYFDLGKYPLAKEYARRAYALHHRHTGLRRKLAEAGYWP